LKQIKWKAILRFIDSLEGKTCLDVGADNGLISYYLRNLGGIWYSADLDPSAIESIKRLVGERVYLIDGRRTPFERDMFDLVVIVDYLEHITTDREFVKEISRIMKNDGTLIINVPHVKPHSLIPAIKRLAGLDDRQHGHVRPGYTRTQLDRLTDGYFVTFASTTYSRFFSEVLDTLISFSYLRFGRGEKTSSKGAVLTGETVEKNTKLLKIYRILYPFLSAFVLLDRVIPFTRGYKLVIASAPCRKSGSPHESEA
jgi:SAM-dependent methyltransferase